MPPIHHHSALAQLAKDWPPSHGQSTHPVYIVQGAQYGSEGKGQIASVIAGARQCGAVIRTGSINAGHTVYLHDIEYKMQLLPTAWVQPGVKLILGPGCFIHRATLAREFQMILDATGEDIRERLYIDHRCTIHTEQAEERAKQAGRHHAMGATGKGSSESVIDRLNERGDTVAARDLLFVNDPQAGGIDFSDCIYDTTNVALSQLRSAPVLLEGTQGAHLDLFLGPWPFTSNRPVSTAAWLAYAGLPPTLDVRVIMVARTFPIRVAGNSGPLPHELTWPNLYRGMARQAGGNQMFPLIAHPVLAEFEANLEAYFTQHGVVSMEYEGWNDALRYTYRRELSEGPSAAFQECAPETQRQLASFFEMTTVTRKLRRIGAWDVQTVLEAIRWNGCSELWISFLNYRYPQLWERTGPDVLACTEAMDWLRGVRVDLGGVPITGVTTGRWPENHIHLKSSYLDANL